MATHRLINTTWHNVLGTVAPALTIASGDVVITETLDARGFDKNGARPAHGPNPMNGPVFVT
ncbi:MAG: acetamidase, partial [Mesorhizobium sp.]